MSETKVNATLFSKFKKTKINSVPKLPDLTGLTLGEFHADSRLDIVSGEADIYLCSGTGSRSEKKFLLKYYRRENAVKQDVLEKLKSVTCPFVAPVEGFGEYEGHQYAVRPYYEMSALSECLLEGTRFSEEELRTLIIPSVIEGLKAVHDAGILHKDLKPANLIPDDAGEHIVLIDFGISSDAGKNTFVVTQTGMTPCYAAPEALQGIFHKETDYYALGITIFELFTGFTPFQNPELSPEEVARLAAISKIEFPDDFQEDLKKLVQGLTYKDISHRNEQDNPNRRWGYDEVRRWLNGEDVPVPGESADVPVNGASFSEFPPYRFNGKTYTTEKGLLRAMLEHPQQGLKDLGRGFMSHHYYAFSEKKGALCEKAEKEAAKIDDRDHSDHTPILFFLLHRLNPEFRGIRFNDRCYYSIQDLGRAFIDEAIKEALQNRGFWGGKRPFTLEVKSFVLSGVPKDYAANVIKDAIVSEIFSITAEFWDKNWSESDTEIALILGYALCDDRRIPIGGKVYESPEVFRKEMAVLAEKDPDAYAKLIDTCRADLEYLEKNIPDPESQKALSLALAASRRAVFGDDEYCFKDSQELVSYMQKLAAEEKPYEIRRLLNRYQTSLSQASHKAWGTDIMSELRKITGKFIRIGEYLFTGEKSFREFITGIRERGSRDPHFLRRFTRAHRDSLDRAASGSAEIREDTAALYAAADAVIVFDEEAFPDPAAFKSFAADVINRGSLDPCYLSEFVKRHRNTIDALLKNSETAAVLKPLIEASESLMTADGRSQETLRDLYEARKRQFCLDELAFASPDEFREFAEQLLSSGKENPACIRRFVRAHEKALTALKNVSEVSSLVTQVLAAGNSVIELDEYVFSDDAGFSEFVRELIRESKAKPLRAADFVLEHQAGLEALRNIASLAPALKELEDAANTREKEEAITVNRTRYAPVIIDPDSVRKGGHIQFGCYPQEHGPARQPIEWLVLEANDKEAFLVSRYCLERRRYQRQGGDITWENCDLRMWLNGDFLNMAFSEAERQRIKITEVVTDNNPKYGVWGGNNTRDQVFCLSIAEVKRYFKNKAERRCDLMLCVKDHGLSDHCCMWWLRSPGCKQEGISYVDGDGSINLQGFRGFSFLTAVRPALWLIFQ